jgi:hypothetical protein
MRFEQNVRNLMKKPPLKVEKTRKIVSTFHEFWRKKLYYEKLSKNNKNKNIDL